MSEFAELIGRVADGLELTADQARRAFDLMADGLVPPAQTAGFLLALRTRGESVSEIVAAVSAMRSRMVTVQAPPGAMDVVGTGGDASGSYNISTATAFVVAGAGVPVAKHGNRALSSRCGAADVLAALGVNIDLDAAGVARCIAEAGIGFMFAPAHHPALRHVGPTRVELATRTVFNLLGPMLNPAGVRRHLIGVYAARWLEPIAEVLQALGSESAWVVHARDGMDEISTTCTTTVVELRAGRTRRFEISPEEVGLPRVPPGSLRGAGADTNAAALRAVLAGRPGPFRDVVLVNSAAALVVADVAMSPADGVRTATEVIDSGRALQRLELLRAAASAGSRAMAGHTRPGRSHMGNMIERVRSYKPDEVAAAKRTVPAAELERLLPSAAAPRGFRAAVEVATHGGGYALIAEIKKASPSKGLIRPDFHPARLAAAYASGGATCLSVLTDAPSFQGAPEHLAQAREATRLPALPKDFMIDPYQVLRARVWGADCVLVILALVDDAVARDLEQVATATGMDVVMEVHDEWELERALALGGQLIGVNNRDLETFHTDLGTCERLAPRVPPDRTVIGESGLNSPQDLARLADVGITAFWVGESLLRHEDVAAATRQLLTPTAVSSR